MGLSVIAVCGIADKVDGSYPAHLGNIALQRMSQKKAVLWCLFLTCTQLFCARLVRLLPFCFTGERVEISGSEYRHPVKKPLGCLVISVSVRLNFC